MVDDSARMVSPPAYQYVSEMLKERDRIYGTLAVSSSSPLTGTAATNTQTTAGTGAANRRSFDLRTREFRLRRQLRIDPRIPPNYRRTTQVIRAGQAMLSDMALRLPALLTAKPLQVVAQPLDDSDDAQQAATKKEEWTHAVLLGREGQRAILDSGATSVWRDLYDNAINVGWGCFSLAARTDRWSDTAAGYPHQGDFDDDGEDTPKRERQNAYQKYMAAVERYRRSVMPFALEHLDPLMVYIREDDEGIEDEAVVYARRPARQTITEAGLELIDTPGKALGQYSTRGTDIIVGMSGAKYRMLPSGFGRPYPARDWPADAVFANGVETVTYYCSARRARALGLIPFDDDDTDLGVWAHFVDGVLVQSGPLWGPPWHPLPVFRAYGLSTGMPDPVFKGVPASLTLLELADALDQIATMKMHIAYWASWPAILEEDKQSGGVGATGLPQDVIQNPESLQQPGAATTKERKVIEPAGFYSVPPGRTWRHFVLPAEATAHLESLERDVRAMLDLLGIPSVFRGAGQSGTSGYAYAQLTLAARSLYDPVVENVTACVQRAIAYLWWQIWKRFRDGVPAYAGTNGSLRSNGKANKGWITLTPKDLAPDYKSPRRPGAPFLVCEVRADPLLPTDELQLEQRGINALSSGILSADTVRDKYFKVQAPEEEAARVVADKVVTDPVVVATIVTRAQVRMGMLVPELAPLVLARKLGIEPAQAAQQLAYVGGLPPPVQDRIEAMAQQQIAAGGLAPGQMAVPGAPGVPPVALPRPQGLPPGAPGGAGGPPRAAGGPPGPTPGQPLAQPTVAQRMSRAL